MPDELSTLLERVAADGAHRSSLSAEAVRARGAGLRRRRRVAAGLGSAALVAGLLGGVAALAGPRPVPVTAAGSPAAHSPAGSTTVVSRPEPGAPSCRRPAAAGDVDGDCKVDRVSVSGGTVVLTGTRAGRLTVAVPHPAELRIASVNDADRDGFAEVWVRIGAGQDYYVLRYDGSAFAAVSDDRGKPLRLRLAGSPARYLLGCLSGRLAVMTATHQRLGTTPVVIWRVISESTHAVC